MKIVMKFGGTSVATGENIRYVANLVIKTLKKTTESPSLCQRWQE